MDVLKKVKASSLMEILIATVLIVVVFMIATLTINTILFSSIKKETGKIKTHLSELQYLYANNKIEIPYDDSFENWSVTLYKSKEEDGILHVEALHSETNKIIERQIRIFE